MQINFLTSSWCCMTKTVTFTILSIKVASTCSWRTVVDPVTGLLQIKLYYNSTYVKGADYNRSVFVIYNIFTNSRYEVYQNIPFNLTTGNISNLESIVTLDVMSCTLVEVCWHF